MTDNKFTDNEIKKAFAELAEFCRKCGNLKKEEDILNNALDLINNYEATIEKLQNAQYDCAVASIDEYAERLKSDIALAMSSGNVPFREIIDELTETMKSEYGSHTDFADLIVEKAIKSFAEKLKGKAKRVDPDSTDELLILTPKTIDDTLKEMESEYK